MSKPLFIAAALTLLVTGCSSRDADTAEEPDSRGQIEDSVIGAPLNDALERARGVDATVQEQAEELRRKVEESER